MSRRKAPAIVAPRRARKAKRTGASGVRSWKRIALITGGIVLLSPVFLVLSLRWIDPPTSAFILQQQWRHSDDELFRIHHEWVSLEQISGNLQLAVIASEDQRFPHHPGFDFEAINDALEDRRAGKALRGASTLSQQLAKNLFLWSERSWFRKGVEAGLTTLLELFLEKKRILEIYLNLAQWGDRQFGVQAASERYFAKHASQLSLPESALLAAVLPNPLRFRVDKPSIYVRQRQRWIMQQSSLLGGTAFLAELE